VSRSLQPAAGEREDRPPQAGGRAFVTGGAGFAGRHLLDLLPGAAAPSREELELLDAEAVRAAVREVAPDTVWHLAALASVGRSWEAPAQTISENVAMTANLVEAIRQQAPEATLVLISSGEIYGPPARLPVDEDAPLRPQNPYAVSKAAADLLAGFYADAYGLRVIRARAFNHAGPGQAPVYAIASFAQQVAAAVDAGRDPIRIVTGNPDTRRDYTDVRDVVRAYRLLAERAEPGVYNICSGRTASSRELVAMLARAAGVGVEHSVDSARLRPHEVMELRGSYDALHAATGWEPEIPLARTLGETLAWWRAAPARTK
jgi:GDP-4-dehydro-6-deoxy-D-mannose reductase